MLTNESDMVMKPSLSGRGDHYVMQKVVFALCACGDDGDAQGASNAVAGG